MPRRHDTLFVGPHFYFFDYYSTNHHTHLTKSENTCMHMWCWRLVCSLAIMSFLCFCKTVAIVLWAFDQVLDCLCQMVSSMFKTVSTLSISPHFQMSLPWQHTLSAGVFSILGALQNRTCVGSKIRMLPFISKALTMPQMWDSKCARRVRRGKESI